MVEFLKNQPVFKSLTLSKVLSLYQYMKKVKFERGAVVYAEGVPANTVYILLKGSFEM